MICKVMFNYNYVLFNSPDNKLKIDYDAYYTICAMDLDKTDQTRLITYPLDTKPFLLRYLYAVHHSEKINRKIRLPLKSLWFPFYFKNDFKNKKPLCFLFLNHTIPLDYLKYLKNKYPDCKLVALHRDFMHVMQRVSPELYLNPIFDMDMTYDENESKLYGMPHFDEFESIVEVKRESYFESDVFFAGKAKDRLPMLLKAYEQFINAGLKVYFYLTEVPINQRTELPGILYADKFMSYKEMLYHSVNTRCMLEITQENQQGYTSRFLEAVMYGKKLITNSEYIKKSSYYNPKYMQVIRDMNNINVSFITDGDGFVDYEYKGDFSPLNMIKRVDEELTKRYIIK